MLRSRYSKAIRILPFLAVVALPIGGCRRHQPGPRQLLARFFDTAVQQDYAATWQCYDSAYRSKIDQQEFVRRRREASRLQAWRLLSLEDRGSQANALVELRFGPSERLNRPTSVTKTVAEQLVRESDGWHIKVW